MLGFIGAALFGIVFTGAWMSAEDDEQKAREEAKKRGNYPYYYDKNRKLRNAYTGKKYSTQDALREIERKRKERDLKNEEEKRKREEYEKYHRYKYTAVIHYNNSKGGEIFGSSKALVGKIELFKTYREALDYIENCYKKANDLNIYLPKIKPFGVSLLDVEELSEYCEIHYNFEKEE